MHPAIVVDESARLGTTHKAPPLRMPWRPGFDTASTGMMVTMEMTAETDLMEAMMVVTETEATAEVVVEVVVAR